MSKAGESNCVFCKVPEVDVEVDDCFDDDLASVALSQVQKANASEDWQNNEIPWYVASQDEQKR